MRNYPVYSYFGRKVDICDLKMYNIEKTGTLLGVA